MTRKGKKKKKSETRKKTPNKRKPEEVTHTAKPGLRDLEKHFTKELIHIFSIIQLITLKNKMLSQN